MKNKMWPINCSQRQRRVNKTKNDKSIQKKKRLKFFSPQHLEGDTQQRD